MRHARIGLSFLALGLHITTAAAQVPHEDLQWIAHERESAASSRHDDAKRGPLGTVLVGGLRVYRAVFSAQDAGNCQFSPSCSHFAEEAIDVHGPFRGAWMASDRLLRCHPGTRGYYWVDPATGKKYDHAGDYRDTEPSTKSAATAMVLSAVLPGAGKVYAGRPWDGVYSALTIGSSATFAVLDFRRDGIGSVRGWFHATLATGFYVGNVFGSGQAARHAGHTHLPDHRPTPIAPNEGWLRTKAANGDGVDAHGLYQRGLTSFARGSYRASTAQFLDVAERFPDSDVAASARFFQSLSHAQLLSWEAAHRSLLLYRDEAGSSPQVERGIEFLRDLPPAPRISPTKAQVFSAIVPGSGQFYARRFDKGLLAMVANGLVIAYVLSTIHTDSFGELAISAAPLFWRYYRGNIASAGRLAHDYNHRREREQVSGFYERLGIDLPERP